MKTIENIVLHQIMLTSINNHCFCFGNFNQSEKRYQNTCIIKYIMINFSDWLKFSKQKQWSLIWAQIDQHCTRSKIDLIFDPVKSNIVPYPITLFLIGNPKTSKIPSIIYFSWLLKQIPFYVISIIGISLVSIQSSPYHIIYIHTIS